MIHISYRWGSHFQVFQETRNWHTFYCQESEYVAATHTAKEAIWLCWFIGKVFELLNNPIPLYSDWQATIVLTCDRSYHTCTKHINIWCHFVVNNGTIYLFLLSYWQHGSRHTDQGAFQHQSKAFYLCTWLTINLKEECWNIQPWLSWQLNIWQKYISSFGTQVCFTDSPLDLVLPLQ